MESTPKKSTPSYMQSLLTPSSKSPQGRKVWSLDLQQVWLPLFHASNAIGDSAIPNDALGAPLRLAFAPDGSVKFNRKGRPLTKVTKPVADAIGLIRENFTAGLVQYTVQTAQKHPEAYRQQVELSKTAGLPINQHDKTELNKAMALQLERAIMEAQKQSAAETVPETPPTTPTPEKQPDKEPDKVLAKV